MSCRWRQKNEASRDSIAPAVTCSARRGYQPLYLARGNARAASFIPIGSKIRLQRGRRRLSQNAINRSLQPFSAVKRHIRYGSKLTISGLAMQIGVVQHFIGQQAFLEIRINHKLGTGHQSHLEPDRHSPDVRRHFPNG